MFSPRFALTFVGFSCFAVSPLFAQGTVTLNNVSYPFTSIEVGNTVQVQITGAAPNGQVTVVQNGGAPYVFGTTDASGNWQVTATETAANIGDYQQLWYVNGVAVTPWVAPPYLGWAPTLPDFSVGTQQTPASPGVWGDLVNTCGHDNSSTPVWGWNPVAYVSSTTYGVSAVNAAAQYWNNAETTVTLAGSTSVQDIDVFDGTLPADEFGETESWGNGCSPCYNQYDECNGACLNSSTIYYENITLNDSAINGTASYKGWASSSEATYTVVHEFGHSLQLDDVDLNTGQCSEVGSVMTSIPELCGIFGPTSRDVATFNSVYPSSPGYCSIGGDYCDGVSCN